MNFSGKLLAATALVCAGVVAIFSGCEKRVPAAVVAEKKGILILSNGGEPSAIDPQFAQPGVIENRIMLALFEGLVSYDPQTLNPVPAIAESWTISDDGLRYEFKLRQDAKFSDGTPIKAEDFLFSFRRILSPKLASPCASLFFAPVKNARKFASGELTDFSQVGFSAPDESTVVVELENPCPYFLSLACHSSWSVVPSHVILKFGEIDERSTLWTRPKNFVGSGAFKLTSWRVAYRIEVEKNPFYWNKENVALNGIRFEAIEDQYAEETAFNDGQFHITNTVPPSRVAILWERKAPQLRLDPYFSTAFIRVNCAKPPLNDKRVRQALSLAIDREVLAKNVLRAGETPAFRLVPSETGTAEDSSLTNSHPVASESGSHEGSPSCFSPSSRSDEGGDHDSCLARAIGASYNCLGEAVGEECTSSRIARAKALLAEAGFPGGENFPEISYLYNTSDGAQFFAQALQEMWRKNLGIKVFLKNQEYKVYRVSLAQGDYELARSAWSGDYLDPTTFLELFISRGNMNWTNWESPRYDELLANAARERDAEARKKILTEAEDILLSDAPIIPTVHPRSKFLIRPEVRGWYPNLLDVHPYSSVHFAEN